MVEISGKKNITFFVNINEAINALYKEASILNILMEKNDSKKEEIKLFLESIELIKKDYYRVYKSNKRQITSDTIKLNGFLNGSSFYMKGSYIIDSLYNIFTHGKRDLMVQIHNNSLGIFDCYKSSYGKSDYKYTLIYEGESASLVYKAISYLDINSQQYDDLVEKAMELEYSEKEKTKMLFLKK